MTIILRRSKIIAAASRGLARAQWAANFQSVRNRPVPSLARVAWLERPIVRIRDERETKGAEFRPPASPDRSHHKSPQGAAKLPAPWGIRSSCRLAASFRRVALHYLRRACCTHAIGCC